MSGLISRLAVATGLREMSVVRVMASAPDRYKRFPIPKRTGGHRWIDQPSKEVKVLQRAFVDDLLTQLPVHQAATAYRPKRSIADNAAPHRGTTQILKMDFKDFFPSIRRSDWIAYCAATRCLTDDDEVRLSASLLFRTQPFGQEPRLAIGAPSSPILSNILMFEFDHAISSKVAAERVVYTRYADDLTFSAPRTGFLTGVQKTVRDTMRTLKHPKLMLNNGKTVYATTKFRRSVTGLILANDGRVTIGKRRKRLLHAAVHNAKLGKASPVQIQRLSGYLAHVNSVEPAFLDVLRRRYGSDFIQILQGSITMRKLTG